VHQPQNADDAKKNKARTVQNTYLNVSIFLLIRRANFSVSDIGSRIVIPPYPTSRTHVSRRLTAHSYALAPLAQLRVGLFALMVQSP
jgi:hypothetical protein